MAVAADAMPENIGYVEGARAKQ